MKKQCSDSNEYVCKLNKLICKMKEKVIEVNEDVSQMNENISQLEIILKNKNLVEINNSSKQDTAITYKPESPKLCASRNEDQQRQLPSSTTDKKTYKCIQTLYGHDDTVNSIIQLKNGKIASGSNDFTIKLWKNMSNLYKEWKHGQTLKEPAYISQRKSAVKSVIQLRNEPELIICGCDTSRMLIYNPFDKKATLPIKTIGGKTDSINKLTKHSGSVNTLIQLKNDLLVSGASDGKIKLWDLSKNYKCIKTIGGDEDTKNRGIIHTKSVNSIIELENRLISSASDDKTIKIWDPDKDYKCIYTLIGHTDSVNSLIQLYDGMIASASNDYTIKIWDPCERYNCINTLIGHSSYVNIVIELNNGLLASGSDDHTVKIWDPDNPYNNLQTFQGHMGAIRTLTQLNNGFIASGSSDMTIKIWEFILY